MATKTAAAFTMEGVLGALALRTGYKPKKLQSSLKRYLKGQYNLRLTNGEWLCLFRPKGATDVDHIRVGLLGEIESDEAVELISWHSQSASHWLNRLLDCFEVPLPKRPNRGRKKKHRRRGNRVRPIYAVR